MSTPKQKAIHAISSLPEDTDAQEIINCLYQIYRIQRGLPARPAGAEASSGSLWGSMRGSVQVAPDRDLCGPILDEPVDASDGVVHR
jgi:hypothetical protein